ncbi:MAG: hypothetical protein JNM17_34400, partial [Archangium sp.]|nr:hypothetical protein [Archangium sp.]
MSSERDISAFILSIEWRDGPRGLTPANGDDPLQYRGSARTSGERQPQKGGLELTVWGLTKDEGPVRATFHGQEAVMFVPRHAETRAGRRVQRALKTLQGTPVDAVYFPTQRALLDEKARIRGGGGLTYEADLKPSNRFAMERFLKGGASLRGVVTSRDGVLRMTNPHIKALDDVRPSLKCL